jgi:hypothetical protein
MLPASLKGHRPMEICTGTCSTNSGPIVSSKWSKRRKVSDGLDLWVKAEWDVNVRMLRKGLDRDWWQLKDGKTMKHVVTCKLCSAGGLARDI